MRRHPPALGAVVVAAVVTLLGATGGAQATAPRDPARLQVTADEFTLVLSRGTIRSGAALIELVNVGEDDHDLALRRIGTGATTRRIPVVRPGEVRTGEFRLRAGRFRLWCTLADHRARGMRGTLIVRG